MGLIEESDQARLVRVALWAVILAVLVAVLVTGKKLLVPFVVAMVIGYIIRDLNHWIGRFKVRGRPAPKWFRAGLSLFIILGLLYGTVEILTYNIELMIAAWPQYQVNISIFLEQMEGELGMTNLNEFLRDRLQNFDLRPVLTSVVSSTTTAIGNFFIIVIYVLFLLLENVVFDHKLRAINRNDPHSYSRIISCKK